MRKLQSVFLGFLLFPLLALAQQMPTPPALAAKSWLLIESASGQELAAQAADERLEPASLTKLMTAYLTFAALKQGGIVVRAARIIGQAVGRGVGHGVHGWREACRIVAEGPIVPVDAYHPGAGMAVSWWRRGCRG